MMRGDDIRACRELVEWWDTGLLDQHGVLANEADTHPREPGNRRLAERDLIERVVRSLASGALKAEWQAEALEVLLDPEYMWRQGDKPWPRYVSERAGELRRQDSEST